MTARKVSGYSLLVVILAVSIWYVIEVLGAKAALMVFGGTGFIMLLFLALWLIREDDNKHL